MAQCLSFKIKIILSTVFLFITSVLLERSLLGSAAELFNGHQVIRTFPGTDDQVKSLQDLRDILDFWTEPRLNGTADIRVSPANRNVLQSFLKEKNISHEILMADVQNSINEEELSQVRRSGDSDSSFGMDWTSYHSVDEIQAWLSAIIYENQDISELIDIGQSTEERRLLVVRIGYPKIDGSVKKSYFADAGMHAREWIAPAICTYFINELLTNRAQYDELLKEIDFYFLPNANPDGYEFSRSPYGDRMWRKTRSHHGYCLGVDPNRNFDIAFGGDGTSSNSCSQIYKGPYAFSEPETKAMSEFLKNRNADWRVYNAFHSYSQMILTSWGYTYSLPDDFNDLKKLGDAAAAALEAVHNTSYKVGSVTQLLPPGGGGSDDWAKGSGLFKYSYTIEVRDTGRYGFLLPANQILPTAEETWAAVLVQANFIKNSA